MGEELCLNLMAVNNSLANAHVEQLVTLYLLKRCRLYRVVIIVSIS